MSDTRVAVRLFGPPEIARDGRPVTVDTRKAVALLAYLVVTGAPHTRDTLSGLLWPDSDQERSRAALRRTLSVLKSALGDTGLLVQGGTIAAELDEIAADTARFTVLALAGTDHDHSAGTACPSCLPALEEAAALYRGAFMAGFSLRDSVDFDDWQAFESASYRRTLATVLERLVAGRTEQDDLEGAIRHARRLLTLDPLHERAHAELIRLYALSGQRAEALRQYRRCVAVLDRELGVAPLEETTALYDAVRRDRLPAGRPDGSADQRTGSPAPPPLRKALQREDRALKPRSEEEVEERLPLVGRQREQSALVAAYEAARRAGRLLVIEGEAGIGKTRLVEWLSERVRAAGGQVVTAACYPGERALAYGLVTGALRSALADASVVAGLAGHWLAEAARLVPEVHELRPGLSPPPPPDALRAQGRFFDGVSQTLLGVCSGSPPGLVVLEDLQWADDASLELVGYLVRRLTRRTVCLVLTWRSDDMTESHPARAMLNDAARDDRLTIVGPARLDRSDVAELVDATLGAGHPLAGRLHDETEGLPFFLSQYLAALRQDGAGGSGEPWPLPGGVRELLRSRLSAVSGTAAQLLTAAAVIGRSFDVDTLRHASGRGEDETVEGLEELLRRRLVAESSEPVAVPTYDFVHDKIRELVYADTSMARARLLHRRAADALAERTRDRPGPDAAAAAHHCRRAGQDERAAQFEVLAGEHARSLYANAQALDHFEAALALGAQDLAAVHEAIGDLRMLRGEYPAARTSYETAAALGADERLAHLEQQLGRVHQRLGDWQRADDHYRAALARARRAGDAGAQGRIHADRSLTAHERGEAEQAWAWARKALEIATHADDTDALAQAHNMLGLLARAGGDLDQARVHLARSLELATRMDHPDARIAALNNLALAHGDAGQTAEALDLTGQALELCRRRGDRHREAALHNNLADLLHAQKDDDAAMRHLKQAVAIFAEIGSDDGGMQPAVWRLVEW